MTQYAIQTKALNFGFSKSKKIIDNLSINVPKGSIYGFLGPNGAGKSTTMRLLTGILPDDTNSIEIFGQSLKNQIPYIFDNIGCLVESPALYLHLSGYDNMRYIALMRNVAEENIEKYLEIVDLQRSKHMKAKKYSLGMKQRLAIASALLNEPEVLILDEPTNGLDPEGIIQIRNLIVSIAKRGITIIIASHLLDEIERICSHVIVLKQGNAIYSGRVDEMTRNQAYFELESHQMDELLSALQSLSYFDEVKKDENRVIATIAHPIAPAELNKLLVEKGIYLSHLVLKKQSLENQFIELVKNQ